MKSEHCHESQDSARNLFDYALDREDIKWLLDGLPPDSGIDPNTVEYELHLLKIVSVGWAVSYYLPDAAFKNSVLEPYWQAVHEFAGELSRTTHLLLGNNMDYFQTLKARLDRYIQAMSGLRGDAEPVQAIGPEFARCCGDADNPFAALIGAKMFASCLANVRRYLGQAGRMKHGACTVQ